MRLFLLSLVSISFINATPSSLEQMFSRQAANHDSWLRTRATPTEDSILLQVTPTASINIRDLSNDSEVVEAALKKHLSHDRGIGHGNGLTRFRRVKKDTEAVVGAIKDGQVAGSNTDGYGGTEFIVTNATTEPAISGESDDDSSECDDEGEPIVPVNMFDPSSNLHDPTAVPVQLVANSSPTTSSTSAAVAPADSTVFKGASSYYLFALSDASRIQVLDAISGAGFKVVRIFISGVYANNKGSDSYAVNDLEPDTVGVYDDDILNKIDQLMFECSNRGLKLLIACADRYALGFWSTNSYATTLGIAPQGSSGAQKITNAALFYTDATSINYFDQRLAHILAHVNPLLGNKPWSQLDSAIYAFEPQNESQGYMDMASSNWVCDRTTFLKSLLPSTSTIKTSSGGGTDLQHSLQSNFLTCPSLDIISVHSYDTNPNYIAQTIQAAKNANPGKSIILGEWGIAGANKAYQIGQFVNVLNAAGISWMIWEIVISGIGPDDFEIWTDQPAWLALTGSGYNPTPTATISSSSSTDSSTSSMMKSKDSTPSGN